MTRQSLLAVGYVAVDVIRHGNLIRQRLGGTAANVAANVAYLGWQAALLGRIGADAPGRRVRFELGKCGVDSRGLRLDSNLETPVLIHEVAPPEHRFVFRCPRCGRTSPRYAPLDTDSLRAAAPEAVLDKVDIVFADRISASSVDLFERAEHSLKVLEPSAKGTASAAARAVGTADILKWSHELRGRLHPVTFEPRAAQLQIESLGAGGVRFRIGDGKWTVVDATCVDPVDTGGAGDWLTAAFLDALPAFDMQALSHNDIRHALANAQGVAALSCLYVGARSLSGLSIGTMRRSVAALQAGTPVSVGRPRTTPRSRARGVCRTCLGPELNAPP